MFTVLNKLGKLCKVSGTVHADPDEFENAHILVQKGLSYIAKSTHFPSNAGHPLEFILTRVAFAGTDRS